MLTPLNKIPVLKILKKLESSDTVFVLYFLIKYLFWWKVKERDNPLVLSGPCAKRDFFSTDRNDTCQHVIDFHINVLRQVKLCQLSKSFWFSSLSLKKVWVEIRQKTNFDPQIRNFDHNLQSAHLRLVVAGVWSDHGGESPEEFEFVKISISSLYYALGFSFVIACI